MFLSYGSCVRHPVYEKVHDAISILHEKRGTLLLPVPPSEVFELTRFVETSNEDPTPYATA